MKKTITLVAAAILSGGMAASQGVSEQSKAVMENIFTRSSVREYVEGKKIKVDEYIEPLLRAGMSAPSAMNRQPWEFIVITDRERLANMSEEFKNASYLKSAQFAIIVCGNLKEAIEGEGKEYWFQDCSAATENILLAAHSMGLGAVWCGIYPIEERTKALQSFLSLPEYIIPLNIIPVGVPANKQEPKDKWKKEKIHWEKFGNTDKKVMEIDRNTIQIKQNATKITPSKTAKPTKQKTKTKADDKKTSK